MTSLWCAQTERMFLARHELHILLDEYLARAVSSAASSTSYAAFSLSAAAAAASASTCAGFVPPPVVPWCACSAPSMPSIASDLLLHMVLLRVTQYRDCLQKSPILVVANKVDVQGHLSEVDLVQGLSAIVLFAVSSLYSGLCVYMSINQLLSYLHFEFTFCCAV